jgi:hypothetical protein
MDGVLLKDRLGQTTASAGRRRDDNNAFAFHIHCTLSARLGQGQTTGVREQTGLKATGMRVAKAGGGRYDGSDVEEGQNRV